MPKGCVPLIYTYSKCKLSINRLSVCHIVPKGVTAMLTVLSCFRVGKIIAVYFNNNSKHLIQNPNSFCIVQTGLVSGNYTVYRDTITL